MDIKSRLYVLVLLTVNSILVVSIAVMFREMKADVGRLDDVLATKEELLALRTERANLAFHQEECTRCHTERRFASIHGTKSDLQSIIDRMRRMPDSRITEDEADRIHASLMLLRCNQCHSGDMMRDLALLTSEQRRGVIREMVMKPGSGIPVAEVGEMLDSYELLLGF